MATTTKDFDLTLPIATLLRTGTAAAHQSAETSAGAGWLTRGELDKEEYVRFLIMLWHVYHILEQTLDQHASHAVLNHTYNPTLLARSAPLLADIAHLLDTPAPALSSHALFSALKSAPPPALAEYTARLRTLAAAPNPAPLLAHAYVRYLSDLSGGQVIRRRVAKAYALEEDGGAGLQFYDFGKLGGVGEAGLGDMRRIKEWYRNGMNDGVGEDKDLKVTIIAEANKAFELNNGLFASLKAPSILPASASPLDSPTLGDPTSPILSTYPHSHADAHAEPASDKRRYPGEVVESPREDSSLVSVASVVSFVLALCLAHFGLVTGGFTGPAGWDKLQAAQTYLAGLVQ